MEEKLLNMGFRPDYLGFGYTSWILENYNTKELLRITKIYEKAGEEFGVTAGAIERSIRHFRKVHQRIYESCNNKNFLLTLKIKFKSKK